MVSNVIVSLKIDGLDDLMDVEVPCQIPISEVEPHLLFGLKGLGIPVLQRAKTLTLLRGTTVLKPEMSLAESGVWDGSTLIVKGEN